MITRFEKVVEQLQIEKLKNKHLEEKLIKKQEIIDNLTSKVDFEPSESLQVIMDGFRSDS